MSETMAPFRATFDTDKSLEEAIQAIGDALKKRSFSVLWDLDLQKKLEEKGFPGGPAFRVLEVCNPAKAKEALDLEPSVGYFLPCKVVAYEEAGQTKIGLLRPTILTQHFDGPEVKRLAEDVEEILVSALEEAR